jgi:hypothetical protein
MKLSIIIRTPANLSLRGLAQLPRESLFGRLRIAERLARVGADGAFGVEFALQQSNGGSLHLGHLRGGRKVGRGRRRRGGRGEGGR